MKKTGKVEYNEKSYRRVVIFRLFIIASDTVDFWHLLLNLRCADNPVLILTMVPQMRQLVTVWLVLCFSCFTGLHIAWLHEVLFQFMFFLSVSIFCIIHVNMNLFRLLVLPSVWNRLSKQFNNNNNNFICDRVI